MDEKIKKAKEKLHKVYDEGDKYELKLLKELETELEEEALNKKTSLTVEQQKEAAQMGVRLADKMELDVLKLKYQKNLQDNGGIKNKKIEELIKNLEKKILK
jgi:hypothetical protein